MLVNLTKDVVLAERVEIADTFLKRAVGLMFRREFDGAMVFRIDGSTSFHGFFCNFPILLICLQNNKVICKRTLSPWSVVEVSGDTVIEMDGRREIPVDIGDEVVILEDSDKGGWRRGNT